MAVPALLDAVAGHTDGYVRFRALVLLSGFNDSRTRDVMAGVLTAPNDRLRAVAYTYFEQTRILRYCRVCSTRWIGRNRSSSARR